MWSGEVNIRHAGRVGNLPRRLPACAVGDQDAMRVLDEVLRRRYEFRDHETVEHDSESGVMFLIVRCASF